MHSKQILMEKLVDNDTYSDFDGKIGRPIYMVPYKWTLSLEEMKTL